MDIFLKRVTDPQEEPQAGPQEVFQKELLSQEMTGPCVLLPLKTFQWDKIWRWKTVTLMTLTLCRVEANVCVLVLVFNKKV